MKVEGQPQTGSFLEFGPFTFDKVLGKLSKRGTPIRLRGMPLKILQQLLDRPGEVVSRGELQSLLWQGTAFGDFEQGLNTAVNLVRKALGDSADQARYIETVPGQGYRFIAPLHFAGSVPEAHTSGALNSSPPAIRETPERSRVPWPRSLWAIAAAVIIMAALAGWAWWRFESPPHLPGHAGGGRPSANQEANDQYNLALNFLRVQNDAPLARKTFERALELDPRFAAARLQRAGLLIIEIYNGYANDDGVLLQAEDDLHQAEQELPGDDGMLLAAQACVYLAQGRLDRIPRAMMEEWWRKRASKGGGSPVWLVIPRMLEGQTEEPLAILRTSLEHNSLANPTRMLIGEVLRTKGDTEGAIQTLERVLQQAPRHPTPAWFLTMAYLDAGKPEEARVLLERMRPDFEKNYMWRHAWAILLAAEGKHKEALEVMDEETLKFARLTWTVTSGTADFYALQGDASTAVEWLQLAISRGDERVAYFRRNPRLATLQTDPRFQLLVKSVEARRK